MKLHMELEIPLNDDFADQPLTDQEKAEIILNGMIQGIYPALKPNSMVQSAAYIVYEE